jgi:hypothetical protein
VARVEKDEQGDERDEPNAKRDPADDGSQRQDDSELDLLDDYQDVDVIPSPTLVVNHFQGRIALKMNSG